MYLDDEIKKIEAEVYLQGLVQEIIDEGNGHIVKGKVMKWFNKHTEEDEDIAKELLIAN